MKHTDFIFPHPFTTKISLKICTFEGSNHLMNEVSLKNEKKQEKILVKIRKKAVQNIRRKILYIS